VYQQPAPVQTIGVPNLLVVKDSMDAGLAGQLSAVLFDHQEELIAVHPEAGNISKDTATQTDPVELHPGSQEYYDKG
jgi:TRAP-type uncharacterized transport system substrate-binding protein